MSNFLEERRQSLEEKFFRRESSKQIEAMKEEQIKTNTLDDLRRASGMDDEEVLSKMLESGLTGETVAALSLVPLLQVAWADGKIQDAERNAILRGAEGKGIEKNSQAWKLLSGWLHDVPREDLFDAWKAYIHAMGKDLLNESQFKLLKTQILAFAVGVAESAGGFLGIGTIAKAENDILARIESAFDQ